MNEVRQEYDCLAGKYDCRWHGYIVSTLSFLRRWIDLKDSQKILDVACGTGALEEMLLQDHPGLDITGIDFSKKMLEVAGRKLSRHPNVHFVNALSFKLPFPEESFDQIICANAFHFFDNPIESILEMKRVLRGSGHLVILDWCRDDFVCRLVDWFWKSINPAYRRCYWQRELNHFLAEAGLSLVKGTRFKVGVMWGMMAVQAVK